MLTAAVLSQGAKNWKKIAESVPGRSDVQCLHRWQKVLNPDLVKGPWTTEARLAVFPAALPRRLVSFVECFAHLFSDDHCSYITLLD